MKFLLTSILISVVILCYSQNGKVVGQIEATPRPSAPKLMFYRVDHTLINVFFKQDFAVSKTGVITITNQKKVDNCKCSSISFKVKVIDNGNPPASATATMTVYIRKFNKHAYVVGMHQNML